MLFEHLPTPSVHGSVMTADPRHLASGRRRSAPDSEPLWWRWLSSLTNAARGFSWRRPSTAGYGREPIFRIAGSGENRWVVERPGAAFEHAFPDLEGVVAFIRHESEATPATVELRIGDLYVVARIDPDRPGSLFGEAVS